MDVETYSAGIYVQLAPIFNELEFDPLFTERTDDKASLSSNPLVDTCYQSVFTISSDPIRVYSGDTVVESVEQPITRIELKELSSHLKYAFLNGYPLSPVIISSTLDASQKARFVNTLQDHRGAIAWSISDIKGINLSFCTNKILMEDNINPGIQPQ